MADQDLSVTISAQDAGANAAVASTNDLLAAMEAQLAKLNATGVSTLEALTVSHKAAAEATAEHAAAETFLGESMGKIETASNSAARVFGAVGLNAGEATERVEALTAAIDALDGAALPLLAIGAAVLAVAGAFNFLHEGIEEAGKAQVTMTALGQAVKDQGGAWDDAAQEGVEKFLDTIERTTTYSRGEVLPALESLVAAGMSVAGAEKVIAVSTDVAAASHRSLTDVVQLLREAELGRARGLEELDPKLKTLIANHADFNTVLNQLAHDMAGQASAAAEAFEGRQKQLGNELAHVGEELGDHLLPMLTTGAEILIGFAEEAEQHEPQIAHFFDTLIDDAIRATSVLADLGKMAHYSLEAASGDVAGMMADQAGFMAAESDLEKRIGLSSTSPTGNWQQRHLTAQDIALRRRAGDESGNVGDTVWEEKQAPAVNASTENVVSDLIKAAEEKAKALNEQAKKDFARYENVKLTGSDDPEMGSGRSKDSGGGPTPVEPISDDAVQKVQAYEVVAKQVDAAIKALTDSERTYKDQVDLSTTATEAANAKLALAKKESDDAREAVGLLTGVIAYDTNELARQTTIRNGAEVAMNSSREEYNRYAASLGEGTKRTEADRASLEHLKATHDEAKKTFEDAQRAIDGITSSIDRNQSALDAARSKTEAYAKAQAELLKAYNDSRDAEGSKSFEAKSTFDQPLEAQIKFYDDQIAALNTFDADYLKKLADFQNKKDELNLKIWEGDQERAKRLADDQQQLDDEQATYGKSTQQQREYYALRYSQLVNGDSNDRAEAQKYADEIYKIDEDAFKKRIDAENQFVSQAEAAEEKLLDDVLEKHESFHATLHEIFQEIGDDFIKMVERMLVEAPLLTNMEKSIAGLFGGAGGTGGTGGGLGGSASSTSAAQAVSMYGVAGLAYGEAGGANIVSQVDMTSAYATLYGTTAAEQAASTAQAAAATGSGPGGSTVAFGSVDAMGNPVVGGSSGITLQGAAGGVLGGAGIGATVGSLDNGNETGASIGGALGGLLGVALHANPLIGAGIDVVSSLLGSLIGGPKANPGQNPDQFEGETGYGQDVANLQGGQSGASGVAYFPTAQIEQFIEAMGVGAGTINGMAGEGQQSVNSNGTIASSGGVDAAEIWLAQNQKDTAQQLEAMGVSPAQFAQWEQLFGVSATGSGQYSHIPGDSNIGDIEVTGATSGGNTKTTYTALASALQQIISAGGGNGSTPVFSMTEAYPGAPAVLSSNPLGTINTSTGVYTPSSTTTAPSTGAGSNVAGTGSNVSTDNTVSPISRLGGVTITFNGNIVGADGVQTVANEIAQALLNQQSGQVPGAPGNSRAARYGLA